LLSLLATSAGAAAASAEPGDAPSADADAATYLEHPEALRLDAEELAKASGRPVDEVLRELELAPVAQELIADVKERAGDRFAGAWVEHEPSWQLHIALTEGTPLALDALTRSTGVPVSVEYREGPSEEILIEEANKLAAWATATPGIDGVEADVEGPELVVYANNEAPIGVQRMAPATPGGVEVRFVNSGEPAGDTATVRGGLALTSCTSGFSVTSGGIIGFATAGHCGNSQSWAATPTGSPANASTYGGEVRGTTADIQYHRVTSPHNASSTFFGGSATTATTRSGTGTAFVGQGLCHRGKTTGYSCGNVTSTTFAPTWANACLSSPCSAAFVRIDGTTLGNAGGDSGGPWFSGAAAYGIHKGGGAGWGVYTPVARLSSLGVTLL
jgi:hypothetical protein